MAAEVIDPQTVTGAACALPETVTGRSDLGSLPLLTPGFMPDLEASSPATNC